MHAGLRSQVGIQKSRADDACIGQPLDLRELSGEHLRATVERPAVDDDDLWN